jgi:hypothetical protein
VAIAVLTFAVLQTERLAARRQPKELAQDRPLPLGQPG